MSRFFSSVLFAGALMIGCVGESESTRTSLIETLPNGCVKIQGSEIGTENLTITVDGVTVTFIDWVEKDDEPGEFVGFTLDTAVNFIVKAGQDVFTGFGTTFIHPDGTGGSVSAISNITICVDEKEPPPCEKDEKGECKVPIT